MILYLLEIFSIIMTKYNYKYGGPIKGSTYRKCVACAKNHSHPNECQNQTQYSSKNQHKMKNSQKYRKFCEVYGDICHDTELTNDIYDKIVKNITKRSRFDFHIGKHKSRQIIDIQLSTKVKKSKKTVAPIPIDCQICMTKKGNFITLSCNHSICKECYDTTIDTKTLNNSCPFCRVNMFSNNTEHYIMFINNNHSCWPNKYPLLKVDKVQLNESEIESGSITYIYS
jgi:hypothetical protein